MDKVDVAIKRLQEASQMSQQIYGKPLVVTISGGKDSSVCLSLAEKAGIPFDVVYKNTTADAPETIKFIRKEFKRLNDKGILCKIEYPYYKGKRTSMWDLIPKKLGPPTRNVRYCCDILKENGLSRSLFVTGVRWAESPKRKRTRGIFEKNAKDKEKRIILTCDNDEKRNLTEQCTLKSRTTCNPIIDWSDDEVWRYLGENSVPVNPLYKCGFRRIGCIGCPLAQMEKRVFEFNAYPKIKKLYMVAFDKMLERRKERGKESIWDSAEEVFHWWMEDGVLPGQVNLFEDTEDE